MTKSYTILALLITALSFNSYCQKANNETLQLNVNEISKGLAVNKDIAKEIHGILRYKSDSVQYILGNAYLKPPQKQVLLRKIYSERYTKISAILSEDQRMKLDSLLKEKTLAVKEKSNELRSEEQKKLIRNSRRD